LTCIGCATCQGCPQGVAIEDTLRCAFYYGAELGQWDYARHVYASLPPERRVLACGDCGRCEAVCRQRLAVRRMLCEAHVRLA
jgi:predicted aldo/keto reductase-like oxidoreductase